MLAQNFKTAADLGISNEEHSALVKLLGMLERGEIPHDTLKKCDIEITPRTFNLMIYRCGSVACIGGWADYVGGLKPFSIRKATYTNPGLHGLCYPSQLGPGKTYANATPDDAAMALRSYLTTGAADWARANDRL